MSTYTERAAIMQRSDLTPLARLLALRIVDMQALSKGACLLSNVALAAELGCSDRQVRRALSDLRAAGLMSPNPDGPGRRIVTTQGRTLMSAPQTGADAGVRAPGHTRPPPRTSMSGNPDADVLQSEREREREREKEGDAREARPRTATPTSALESEREEYRRALVRGYRDAFEQHTKGRDTWLPGPHEVHLRHVVSWAMEYRTRLPEADRPASALVPRLLAGFFAAKSRTARPSIAWLAEDPGRYLESKPAAPTHQAERAARPEPVGVPLDIKPPQYATEADLPPALAALLGAKPRPEPEQRTAARVVSIEDRRAELARQAAQLRASMEAAE